MDRQSNNGTALYCRLSRDDDNIGDSNSIQHQEKICQGQFHRKIPFAREAKAFLWRDIISL